MVAVDMGLAPEYMMRDNDTKLSAQFYVVLKSSGAIVKRNKPKQTAVTEPAGPCGTVHSDFEVQVPEQVRDRGRKTS